GRAAEAAARRLVGPPLRRAEEIPPLPPCAPRRSPERALAGAGGRPGRRGLPRLPAGPRRLPARALHRPRRHLAARPGPPGARPPGAGDLARPADAGAAAAGVAARPRGGEGRAA